MVFARSTFVALAAAAALAACSQSAPPEKTAAAASADLNAPSQLVMRRLTGEQYKNVMTDVFGPTIDFGGRFEPDMRTDGLLAIGSSHIGVTAAGMEQYDAMSRTIARQIVDPAHRDMMLSCKPKDVKAADDACVRQIIDEVGLLLYRRPLTDAERDAFVTAARLATDKTQDFYTGLSLSLASMMSSPKFLFRAETATPVRGKAGEYQLDAYSTASRLSFFLWNSGPDATLMQAAAKGELSSPRGIAKQVDRMLASPRVESGVRAFFVDFLGFDEFENVTKDTALFPKFSTQAASDAQEQTLRTIIDVVLTNKGDYRDIFTTRKTFLTKELGAIYQVPVVSYLPNGSPDAWQPYEFSADDNRAGIMTHMSFTALHSPSGRGSAVLRGKAVREVLLCQKVPAPPGDVNFDLINDTTNYRTARDRLAAHTREPMCAGCHKITDPMGLALENFDAAGAWRTTEGGVTLDTSGAVDGKTFTGPADLGKVLASMPAATSCVANRMLGYALGRAPDRAQISSLEKSFATAGYRIPALMRLIATSESFTRVKPEAAPTQTASVPAHATN
ncbi:MAG: DUF1592 domain-containing protein [Proteobacteria bacterium]|nr:DUF1592 domain-containing protein [Pseudomonadota bacterium]